MHLEKYKYSDQVGLLDGSFYCSKITAIKLPKITELGAKLAAECGHNLEVYQIRRPSCEVNVALLSSHLLQRFSVAGH